jgi:hypothetical protein
MLKKMILLFICILVISSCNENSDKQEIVAIKSDVEMYFPFEPNVMYEYDNSLNEAYANTVYSTYIKNNKVQRINLISLGATTEVIEYKNGELKLVYGDNENYLYEDVTGETSNVDVLILKEPLKLGNKWNYTENIVSEITNMEASVSTEVGEFVAMEVTNTAIDGTKIEKNYYVKDMGLIKSVSESDNGNFSRTLVSRKDGVGLTLTAEIYGYDIVNDDVVIEQENIILFTDFDFNKTFETLMKKSEDNKVAILTPNTKINSIDIVREDSLLIIDLSKDFTKELDMGSNEMVILKCIANTLGNFYSVDSVSITVDGLNYESEYMELKTNEYIEVQKKQ